MAGLTISAAGTYDGAGATTDFILIEGVASGDVIVKNYIVSGFTTYGDMISVTDCALGTLTLEHILAGSGSYILYAYDDVTFTTFNILHCDFETTDIYTVAIRVDSGGTVNITNSLLVGGEPILDVEQVSNINLTNVTTWHRAGSWQTIYVYCDAGAGNFVMNNCNLYANPYRGGSGEEALYISDLTSSGSGNNYWGYAIFADLDGGGSISATNLDPSFASHAVSVYNANFYLPPGSALIDAGINNVSNYDWISSYPYSVYDIADTGNIDIGFHYPSEGEIIYFYEIMGIQDRPRLFPDDICVEPIVFDTLHDFYGNKVGF